MLIIPNKIDFEFGGRNYTFWSEKPAHLYLYKCLGLYIGAGLGESDESKIESYKRDLEGLIQEKGDVPEGEITTKLDSEIRDIKAKINLFNTLEKYRMPNDIRYVLAGALINLVKYYIYSNIRYYQEDAVADVTDFVVQFHKLKPYRQTDVGSERLDNWILSIRALGYRPLKIRDIFRLKK